MSDTIFALATAPGRAGLAVIRISGPDAEIAALRLTRAALRPRRPSLRTLGDPSSGEPIDEALMILFPAPRSYTGEVVVEIQCHGSPAVIRRLLAVLGESEGLRLARPGEFTRRALESGRLDLAQVEGLGDLLAAETEAQRRQARAVAAGLVSSRVEDMRVELLEVLALVEAVIDFGEDGVPSSAVQPVPGRMRRLADSMQGMLEGGAAAERIRDGFIVALCGEPNVGKSTLLNAIAGRDVALTSEIAGTTRDVIEVQLDLRGLPVTLLDTAGLREAEDAVERMGIERTRSRADAADLRVFLVDGPVSAVARHMQEGDIVVRAKTDLHAECAEGISGRTGQGVDRLLGRIAERLETRAAGASDLAHARQREAIAGARASLLSAVELLSSPDEVLDLVAFELQSAARSLDVFSGRVDVEAVLDHVFRSFCLGK